MVQSEKSGVMFTVEPVSSDRNKIVVEAVYGLGEAIVSGEVTPDLYVLDKATVRVLDAHPVRQERMLVKDPEAVGNSDHANIWKRVPEQLRDTPKLPGDEVVRIAEIGKAVERHYGAPQDIEWAYEGGEFFLVQTRPVTTMKESDEAESEADEETQPVLVSGSAASPGVASGVVRLVTSPAEMHIVQPGDVLVTEMTTPDFVPAMKKAVAIVTNNGGRTCHAAIVSRELGIPCVVGTGNATETLKDGQQVTVDGSGGKVYEGIASARLAWYEKEKDRYAGAANLKTKTRLYVNLAEPELADVVAQRNVDGVGLLRAEFICTQIGEHPRNFIDTGRGHEWTDRLAEGLEAFAKAFHPRPVVYRMTDFKTNEYRNLIGGEKYEAQEENPMIGYRGAGRYIKEPDVTALEVAAIKRVREKYKNLYVMVPFVRTPKQFREVKQLLAKEGLTQDREFKLWMMVEVPSNVLLLDKFIDEGVDGISIGSNDLTQLVLGIDRDSGQLAEDFDERDDAVMWAIERAVTTARRRGITASICGQAPSVYPEVTRKLVEWGITSVSVSPDMIDQTRQIIADLEAEMSEPKPLHN
jgi:pyruvate,water dikinase